MNGLSSRSQKSIFRAQLEKARLKYEKIVSSASSDYKAAKAASQEVSDSLSKLIAAKNAFKLTIAFQVLKPEQRGPAVACGSHWTGHFGFHKRRKGFDDDRWN